MTDKRHLKQQHEAASADERKAWQALNEAKPEERATLHELWEETANRLAKIAAQIVKLEGKPKL